MEQSQLEDLATECMLTARDMVRQGVLSETATDVVNQALDKDFNVQEMQSLRSSFMSQSALGSGESLAKNYSDAIQNGNGSLDNRGNSFGGNTDAGNADSGGSDGGGNNGSAGDSGSGGDSSGGNSDGGNGGSGGSGGNGGSSGGSGR